MNKKNVFKKFSAALLMAVMLLHAVVTVGAVSDSEHNKMVQRLYFLKIAETGAYEDLSATVSRGDFTNMVIRALGYVDAAAPSAYEGIYPDVPSTDKNAKSIELASKFKIVSGQPDGNFYPNDPITKVAAIKMLVCALEYEKEAASKGGWTSGYITMAQQLKMLQGIALSDINENADALFVATLFNNALDAKINPLYFGNGYVHVRDEDVTLLQVLLNDKTESKGILERTYQQAVGTSLPMAKNCVMINGVIYQSSVEISQELLGKAVVFIYDNVDGERVIYSIYEDDKKNQIENIAIGEVDRFQNNTITYIKEDEEKEISLSDKHTIIYNNRVLNGVLLESIDLNKAELTLIDNNQDYEYDYIFIHYPQVVQINSIDTHEMKIFLKNGKINGSDIVDYSGNKRTVVLDSVSGESVSMESIQSDSYAMMAVSRDGMYIEITVLDKPIEGTVDMIEIPEAIRIDGQLYHVSNIEGGLNFAQQDISVGQKSVFYVDKKGEIVVCDPDYRAQYYQYGYVYAKDMSKGIGSQISFKIFSGTKAEVRETEGKVGEYKLYGAADQIVSVHEAAENIRYTNSQPNKNGQVFYNAKITPDVLYNEIQEGSIIKYRTNSEGKIVDITIPEATYQDGDRRLNCKSGVFGQMTEGAFGFDDTTTVFFVPNSNEEDDFHAQMVLNNNTAYTVQPFDVAEDTCMAGAFTVKLKMNIDEVSNFNENANVSIVDRVSSVLDDQGDINTKVVVYTNNSQKEYVARLETAGVAEELAKLKKGDIVYLSFDAYGQINAFKKVTSLNYSDSNYYNVSAEELAFGSLYSFKYKTLGPYSNEFKNYVEIATSSSKVQKFILSYTDGPSIYVYDQGANRIDVGSADSLQQVAQYGVSDYAKIFLYQNKGKAKIVVIVKP